MLSDCTSNVDINWQICHFHARVSFLEHEIRLISNSFGLTVLAMEHHLALLKEGHHQIQSLAVGGDSGSQVHSASVITFEHIQSDEMDIFSTVSSVQTLWKDSGR